MISIALDPDMPMLRRALNHVSFAFALLAVTMAGCAGSRTAADSDDNTETVEGDPYTDRVRSEGIAGAAAQNVGWDDTISGEEADRRPFALTEQLLHGQVAGVEVRQYPGGGFAVRIRGSNSFLAGNEPLYIVDGMPVLHLTGRGLDWLNARDIKKIEIIKDIDARAIYGSRGANGVVLITTKLGPEDTDEGPVVQK